MKSNAIKIAKPADALLPAALLAASVLNRPAVALWLFIALYGVKLCALAASDGLRRAFSLQPSMKSVQGSAVVGLILQFPGALVAWLIARYIQRETALTPLIACGLLLNIEHVFYEYLYATGDDRSAAMLRSVTSVLTLMGLLLCPPAGGTELPAFNAACLLIPSALSALVGLAVSLSLGGMLEPKLNAEVLRQCLPSMLQAALYPAAALAGLRLLAPTVSPALPLFAGLVLYSLCRSPFRRTPAESWPMNQALLAASVVASAVAVAYYCLLKKWVTPVLLLVCLAILLAALCAFILYGNVRRGRREEA